MKNYYVRAALVGAIYAVACVIFAPISYGPVQVRVAEALTVLPVIMPEAVLGLFAGCLVANIFGGLGFLDIGLGSIATLIAAFLTSRCKSVWTGAIWPVVVNGLVVGIYLSRLFNVPLLASMGYVALGEAIAVYGFGILLVRLLERHQNILLIRRNA